MKSLLLFAAIATTVYVSYSYRSTDGQSCLVCPMTGEPIFTSTSPETGVRSGQCCARGNDSQTTGLSAEGQSCCHNASGSCCQNGDAEATLTSATSVECEGSSDNGCCKDKEAAVDLAEASEAITPEDE